MFIYPLGRVWTKQSQTKKSSRQENPKLQNISRQKCPRENSPRKADRGVTDIVVPNKLQSNCRNN